MADETAVVAEPSTAQPEAPAPTDLNSLNSEQYAAWRSKGTLPEPPKPEKPATPDPSKETTSEAKPEEGEAEIEPASEPGDEAQEGPEDHSSDSPGRDKRIKQLIAQRNEARKERDQLRAKLQPAEKQEEKAEAKPPSKPKPTPEDVDERGNPKFATYEDYVEAVSEWKAEEKAKAAVEAYKADTEKAAKDAEAAKARQEQEQSWLERVEKAKKDIPDLVEVALSPEVSVPIAAGSVADVLILESEVGPKILYHLVKHPEELERIGKLTPIKAARELFKLESTLLGSPSAEPPAKPITRAPRPEAQVGGKRTAPTDEAMDAVKRGDVSSYMKAANARDLAHRAGKG